jgi:hypothetical protein
MSKKLQGNGLFESSRMMLPEHRESYLLHQQNLRKKSRPQLDDQEMERLSGIIAESILFKKEITLVIFGEFDNAELTGVITKIDQEHKTVKLSQENGFIWIKATDILDAKT